jgi:hypothetical protein
MPFGCSGGFQLTKMESPDITSAFTALGASGTAMQTHVIILKCRTLTIKAFHKDNIAAHYKCLWNIPVNYISVRKLSVCLLTTTAPF